MKEFEVLKGAITEKLRDGILRSDLFILLASFGCFGAPILAVPLLISILISSTFSLLFYPAHRSSTFPLNIGTTTLRGVTSQKTVVVLVTALRASYLTTYRIWKQSN
jgi:hypothetical protein